MGAEMQCIWLATRCHAPWQRKWRGGTKEDTKSVPFRGIGSIQKIISIPSFVGKPLVSICLNFQGLLHPFRWCEDACSLTPGETEIPLNVTNSEGDEVPMNYPVSCIWPWDILAWLWNQGHFLQWVCDEKEKASEKVLEYWQHCSDAGLEFFERLELPESQWSTCVPLFFHTDGVKIYRNQKAWIYSYSSGCRKGLSTETKLVFLLLREAMIIKDQSHDQVGALVGYVCRTLMTGRYPHTNEHGASFPKGSQEEKRAGSFFAGGVVFGICCVQGGLGSETNNTQKPALLQCEEHM